MDLFIQLFFQYLTRGIELVGSNKLSFLVHLSLKRYLSDDIFIIDDISIIDDINRSIA